MKKYRLKNKELQKKLDALSEVHQFSGRLQTACERQFRDLFNHVLVEFGRVAVLNGSDTFTHVFYIPKSDIEEYEGYNPKKWNEYRKVMPPTNVLMRVEIQEPGRQNPIKTSGIYDGSRWSFFAHGFCSPCDIRFRPWDDEEDEE